MFVACFVEVICFSCSFVMVFQLVFGFIACFCAVCGQFSWQFHFILYCADEQYTVFHVTRVSFLGVFALFPHLVLPLFSVIFAL